MKFLSEYRDQKAAEQLAGAICKKVTRPWTIMEICGGQTHTIVKSGLEDLLPKEITLVHGPGCPVCVTPIELIDKAVAIAKRPDAIFCSFGDMLRVPGSSKSLFDAKAEGAGVRIVYSPLDALKLAKQNPEKQVVFLPWGSRLPRLPTPWPRGRLIMMASKIFRYSSRTSSFRPRWKPYFLQATVSYRGSSPLATSAP